MIRGELLLIRMEATPKQELNNINGIINSDIFLSLIILSCCSGLQWQNSVMLI